jgi:hypothetical protein
MVDVLNDKKVSDTKPKEIIIDENQDEKFKDATQEAN